MESEMTTDAAASIQFEEIDDKFEQHVREFLNDLYPTTSKNILAKREEELETIIKLFKGFRYQAIAREVEYDANMFFLMQCALSCIRSTYSMLKRFKEEDNVGSWHNLIDAYDYINISIKILDMHSQHLETEKKTEMEQSHGLYIIRRRIKTFETTLFRPQKIYNSTGLIESIGNCSICGSIFHECDHAEGDIVMGRLCRRINREIIRADHAAIVKDPKDRRCIFTSTFDDKGISIDFFSREPLLEPKEKNVYTGIMQVIADIDID